MEEDSPLRDAREDPEVAALARRIMADIATTQLDMNCAFAIVTVDPYNNDAPMYDWARIAKWRWRVRMLRDLANVLQTVAQTRALLRTPM